jgi:hypothetical protein
MRGLINRGTSSGNRHWTDAPVGNENRIPAVTSISHYQKLLKIALHGPPEALCSHLWAVLGEGCSGVRDSA